MSSAPSTNRAKADPTPRQAEIKKISAKQRAKRSELEQARLDQLKMEERRDRFERLAVKRVRRALAAIRGVERLGDRNSYSCTESESKKIVDAILDASQAVVIAFGDDSPKDAGFTF